MMSRSLFIVCLSTSVCVAQAVSASNEGPRQIRLAPQSNSNQIGAFRYRLLPDPRDCTPGNAAPLWRLAGDAFHDVKRKITYQESMWAEETLLEQLPRKEIKDFLRHYAAPLSLARQAASREYCDWELPPVTFQSVQIYLPLTLLQRCREVANLLRIQCRLALVEQRFDDAAETLQTGFALARHLCEGDILVDFLVGIAIDAIMFSHVEEWIQIPGSPNLYWALTALPHPIVNLHHSINYDMNSLYRSLPRLRRLGRETLSAKEAERLVDEVFDSLSKVMIDKAKEADTIKKQAATIREGAMYPEARKHLLDLGRSAKEIEALPKTQVILLWYVDQYDQAWADISKSLTLPAWQAMPLMDAVVKKYHSSDNIPLKLLLPAMHKTWLANLRFERQLASLRCAEALRLYAAKHEGKPPAKWSDITEVPLPIDPLTGKGFDNFYQLMEGRGILETPPPPPPGMPASLGRRYELAQPR